MNDSSSANYDFYSDVIWEDKDQMLLQFGALEESAGDEFLHHNQPFVTASSRQAEAPVATDAHGHELLPTNGLMMMDHHQYFDDDNDQDMMQELPLEEFFHNALYLGSGDADNEVLLQRRGGFLDPLLDVDTTAPTTAEDDSIGLPLEERYKATLETLRASMKRSQETRQCLTMKTCAITESYERSGSVREILSSIKTSSGQVQKYVTTSMKRRAI